MINPPTVNLRVIIMCSSRKYPYSPHRRDWNFPGVGGFFEIKKFKEIYGA